MTPPLHGLRTVERAGPPITGADDADSLGRIEGGGHQLARGVE